MLYELGQGENIAGVTRFCDYPPEAALKEKIGGYANHNYEMILRLKPDLAVIIREQRDIAAFLDKYKIRYVAVGSESVEEIIESVRAIAGACFVAGAGDSLARHFRRRISAGAVSGGPRSDSAGASAPGAAGRPKVLLCVNRDGIGSGAVGGCYAAGASSFYNQLIELAGGANALGGVPQAYPARGAEAVIRLDPDIIVDISSAHSENQRQSDCGDWQAFKTVSAVRRGRVHCLKGGHLMRPGPRFVLILDDFRSIFQ
jgi:iron complex transport system substrate-binding protein